jgi:hypothetical protein
MSGLLNINPLLFAQGQVIGENFLTYTPNDYGLAINGQKDLDLINAKTAWDNTTGSSNIVIGITDSYFNDQHEDLVNQIVNIRSNTQNIGNEHGTWVAGTLAAQADNNKGISGIGFNCKLDVSDSTFLDEKLKVMSNEGIRILNGSWINNCSYNPYGQGIYHEIYENGTIACFGAGNGYKINSIGQLSQNHCNLGPAYPAAYDYNISVSSVGSEVPIGQKSWWSGLVDSIYWNQMDVHENVLGAYDTIQIGGSGFPIGTILPVDVHNHNSKIDIVAPGYTVRTTHVGGGYTNGATGTSFASPLVAGTLGLMLSAKPWLSPYQLEYGLKMNAHNIYNIPENQPYIGKLGAGRLDAGASVNWAKNHNVNSQYTTTMHILGVKLNTICQPGSASNSVLPQLELVFKNGTAPYTYKWEAIASNNTTLDAYDIPNPTIIFSSSNHLAYYRVTVYDNSQIQKVASKIVKIQLTNQQSYDLAMRDSYMDMLDEPNNQMTLDPREWNVWESQDVWNRQLQDGQIEHQNPEYFTTNPNYVYARVRNVGCTNSPLLEGNKGLRLYWTKTSTGEDWPTDWTTTNVIGTGGGTVPGGREITSNTIDIPSLAPGQEYIVSHEWYPQAPEDYDPTINTVDVCFLARLEESNQSPYGMAAAEVTKVKDNILNNNNIVTRNFIVTNFRPRDLRKRHQILVANADEFEQEFDIQLINERAINPHFSGNMSEVGYITVFMGDLFDRWVESGMQGTHGDINEEQRSIIFDGSETLYLRNIPLEGKEKISIILEFTLRDGGFSEIPFTVHFRQLLTGANPNNYEEHPFYGNVTYRITPTEPKYKSKNLVETEEIIPFYNIFPNPTTEHLNIKYIGEKENTINISIVDVNGRLIKEQSKLSLNTSETRVLNIKNLPKGMYFIIIQDTNGHTEQYKFIKI